MTTIVAETDPVAPSRPRRAVELLRSRPELVVGAASVVVLVANLAWATRHRHPGSLNIDEANYSALSLELVRDLTAGRWAEFADGLASTAPVVPLLTLPVLLTGSRSVNALLVAQALLVSVCAVGVTALTRRLAGPAVALVAGLAAVAVPVSIHAGRDMTLATGGAASVAVALWALLRSERGRRRGPMVLFGVAVGTMLLSRTMYVAFLPAMALATAVQVRREREVLRNVALAAGATLLVAGPWWILNWSRTWTYLFDFGYAPASLGNQATPLVVRPTTQFLELVTQVGSIVVLGGIVVVAAAWWPRRRRTKELLSRPWSPFRRDVLTVLSVPALGYVALLSSYNTGWYFNLPLLYPLIAAVAALSTLVRVRLRRAVAVAVLGSVAGTFVVSQAGTPPTAGPGLPLWQTFDALAERDASSTLPREDQEVWWSASVDTVSALAEHRTQGRPLELVLSGGYSERINPATVRLAAATAPLGVPELSGALGIEGDAELRQRLRPPDRDRARVVAVIQPATGELWGRAETETVRRTAVGLGWRVSRRIALPDGGAVSILTHPDGTPSPPG